MDALLGFINIKIDSNVVYSTKNSTNLYTLSDENTKIPKEDLKYYDTNTSEKNNII